jgi:hypothetical protein
MRKDEKPKKTAIMVTKEGKVETVYSCASGSVTDE